MTTVFRITVLLLAGLALSACNTGFGRSSNADIERLSVAESNGATVPLSPSFDDDETDYTATVPFAVDTVVFNAVTEDENATMRIDGAELISGVDLSVALPNAGAQNTIRLVVTAENEREKTYTFRISRNRAGSSSDAATLSALTLNDLTLDQIFDSESTSYTASASYLVPRTRIIATMSDSDAVAQVVERDVDVFSDVPSDEIVLQEGEQTLTLQVTAEDRVTTLDYTIAVTRGALADVAVAHYVKADSPAPDDGDNFGSALAADGDWLAVGAPGQDDAGLDSGLVYLFQNNGGVWSEAEEVDADNPAADERFGASVALDGDILAVGAPGSLNNTGAVYIYERQGNDWNFDVRLEASTGNPGDEFGYALSLQGDELLVGAPGRNNDRGAVYVFTRNDSNDNWEDEELLQAGNGGAGDRFGQSVGFNPLRDDDDRLEIAVGAPFEDGDGNTEDNDSASDAGAVYLFERDDDTWSQRVLIKADVVGSDDEFGTAVAMEGNRLAVGAPGESNQGTRVLDEDADNDSNVPDSGAAYIFERDSTGDDTWDQVAYLKPSQERQMRFGTTISLSAGMLAVGAPEEDGDTAGINPSDEGDSDPDSGAVYLFSAGNPWIYEAYVKASNTGESDRFGSSLLLFEENLIVGAINEDGGNRGVDAAEDNDLSDAGAVYIVR